MFIVDLVHLRLLLSCFIVSDVEDGDSFCYFSLTCFPILQKSAWSKVAIFGYLIRFFSLFDENFGGFILQEEFRRLSTEMLSAFQENKNAAMRAMDEAGRPRSRKSEKRCGISGTDTKINWSIFWTK